MKICSCCGASVTADFLALDSHGLAAATTLGRVALGPQQYELLTILMRAWPNAARSLRESLRAESAPEGYVRQLAARLRQRIRPLGLAIAAENGALRLVKPAHLWIAVDNSEKPLRRRSSPSLPEAARKIDLEEILAPS
jgi:hypothetical protein